MRKHYKSAMTKRPLRARPPVFNDDPAQDDPHDAIDQELLGIWLSISRLRQLIRGSTAAAPGGGVTRLPRRPAPKKSTQKKPRRRAA